MLSFGVRVFNVFEHWYLEFLQEMICFTIDFFFFEVLGETFTAGIVERIFFLKNDCTTYRESNICQNAKAVYCVFLSEWKVKPNGVFHFLWVFLNAVMWSASTCCISVMWRWHLSVMTLSILCLTVVYCLIQRVRAVWHSVFLTKSRLGFAAGLI